MVQLAPVAASQLAARSKFRVAIVSTFPPSECGIGNYTRELVAALGALARDFEVLVIAEHAIGAVESPSVRRVWNRRGRWVDDILAAVDKLKPDLVHIQHEESIQGQGREMLRLVNQLRARKIAIAVTLHSVYDGWFGRSFHRGLSASGAALIVHQNTGMADVLEKHRVSTDQIAMIAHGTPSLSLPAQVAARAALGLPLQGTIAMFFGFIHPKKAVHIAVQAFERAARGLDDRLVIVGRIRRRRFLDTIYAASLRRHMRDGIANNRIIFRPGFVAPEDKAAYFAAADLLVLPHQQSYGSASGVLHEAFAARRAFICSRGKKFAEAVEVIVSEIPEAFPAGRDIDAWTHGFERMLSSAPLRTRMSELASQLADATSWTSSADRHAALYASTLLRTRQITVR